MVYHRGTIMPYSYSGDQNDHFECLINVQGPKESEKYIKMPGSLIFCAVNN